MLCNIFGVWLMICFLTVQDLREGVIQACYMDESDEDQRLPHHKDPNEYVNLDQLAGEYPGVLNSSAYGFSFY